MARAQPSRVLSHDLKGVLFSPKEFKTSEFSPADLDSTWENVLKRRKPLYWVTPNQSNRLHFHIVVLELGWKKLGEDTSLS